MTPSNLRNIIVLVSDSLRYDTVYDSGVGLPYVQQHGVQFTEARSGGCWTLPATASLFTGLMPHEHGATAQTRGIHDSVPTLAEKLKSLGYMTYQVTANVATTHIFGLHRGFDEVRRIWKMIDPKMSRLYQMAVTIGKPRLREKMFSKDVLMGKMSEDMETAKTWMQHTYPNIFDEARKIIAENEAQGKKSFIFLNIMETHFPYHIAPTFQLDSSGIWGKWKEIVGLFKMLNQSFLKTGYQDIDPQMMDVLKGRQRKAWQSICGDIDEFCREMHEDKDSIVVFGADHGENFGDEMNWTGGWSYHFSNVTDGGNKVPLFWLGLDSNPRTVTSPVSARHIHNSILKAAGFPTDEPCLITQAERSIPILQSYWYNNNGKTLPKYKVNQFSFLYNDHRFLLRSDGKWFQAPFHTAYDDPDYRSTPDNANPIEEMVTDAEHKKYLRQTANDFKVFSDKIMAKKDEVKKH